MIVRFWLLAGVLLTALAWALTVIWPPPDHQTSVASMADTYRAAGMLPPAGALTMSDAVGHDVFEIPDTDARHAVEEATAPGDSGEENHAASDDGDHGAMPAKDMPMKDAASMTDMATEEDHSNADAPMKDMPMKEMAKEEPHGEAPMAGMPAKDMPMKDMATQDMPMKEGASMQGMADMGGHGGGGSAFGMTVMAQGRVGAMAAMHVSRTVEIEMREWGYTPANLTAKPGEVLRLVVRNAGNVPHEFMIMQPGGMQAVNYRLERADWTLTEHEALFEKPVVMPGDSFEIIVRIDKPGAWMFMCMFPYHMQMGMMGMVMTEGASMGGMKMDMGGGSMDGGAPSRPGDEPMKGMDGKMGGDSPAGMKMDKGQ